LDVSSSNVAFIFRNIFVGVMIHNFDALHKELAGLDESKNKSAGLDMLKKRLEQKLQTHKILVESSESVAHDLYNLLK
jgi:hypothetical protein